MSRYVFPYIYTHTRANIFATRHLARTLRARAGVEITTEKGFVTFGKARDVKIYSGDKGKLQVSADSINFAAKSVTVRVPATPPDRLHNTFNFSPGERD